MKIWLLKVAFCLMDLFWGRSVLLATRRDNTADIILKENNLWVFLRLSTLYIIEYKFDVSNYTLTLFCNKSLLYYSALS